MARAWPERTDGRSDTVPIWEADTGRLVRTLPTNESLLPRGFDGTGYVAFAPDGKSLAACDFQLIVIWETSSGRMTRVIRGPEGGIFGIRFAPDAKSLAFVGGDETLRIWSLATGEEVRPISAPRLSFRSLAFSPDGEVLAAGCRDQTIRLWRVATGEMIRRFLIKGTCYQMHSHPMAIRSRRTMSPMA